MAMPIRFDRYRVSIPWLLKQAGVRKWAKERGLHVPEKVLVGWLELMKTNPHAPYTEPWWRWFEARVVDTLYDGVVLKVEEADL